MTQQYITIPVELGILLTQVIELSAERGAFKLDDFAAIGQIHTELKRALENRTTPVAPPVPAPAPVQTVPAVHAHNPVIPFNEAEEPELFNYDE